MFYFFVYLRLGDEENLDLAVGDDVLPDLNELRLVHGHIAGDPPPRGKGRHDPLQAVIGNDADGVSFAHAEQRQS